MFDKPLKSRHAGLAAILMALLCLLCRDRDAAARAGVASVKTPRQVPLCNGGIEVEIKLHPSFITTITTPLPVGETFAADDQMVTYWVHPEAVYMRPNADVAQFGDVTSAEIKVGDTWVSCKIYIVEDPALVDLRWELVDAPALCPQGSDLAQAEREQEQFRATVAGLQKHTSKHVRALQRRLAATLKNLDEVTRERDALKRELGIHIRESEQKEQQHAQAHETWQANAADNQRQWLEQSAHEYLEGSPTELYAVSRRGKRPSNEAYAEILHGLPVGVHLRAKWRISNPEALPLRIVQIQQIAPLHRTRVLDIGTANVPRPSEGRVTTITSGKTVEGVVIIPHVTPEELHSLALAFVTDTGRQLTATQIEFFPMSDGEKEDRRRDEEAKDRISIHAVGLAGAVWLANPLNEKDLDATMLKGIGARAGYGFNRYFAFEGELVYGWSGNASFDQGLTRSAKLGRLSAGLVLSLGYNIIPTFRAGLGVQGVSHDAQMEAGVAPDIDFEVDGVWYLSGGVDLRLSEGLKIGAEVSFAGQATEVAGYGTTGILQAGVHAAWSWQPAMTPHQ